MVLRRAIDEGDRASRRAALLDAAERLVADNPRAVPSVAQVAEAAGFAKGTVYLYFPSKESLLDALWEREIEAFFGALADDLDSGRPDRFDHLAERVLGWLAGHPVFLALAALGCGATRDAPVSIERHAFPGSASGLSSAASGITAGVPIAEEPTTRGEVSGAGGGEVLRVPFAAPSLTGDGASSAGTARIDETAHALAWRSLALVIGLARLGRARDVSAGVRALWRGFERNPRNAL